MKGFLSMREKERAQKTKKKDESIACEMSKQSGEKDENGNELQGPICNYLTTFVLKLLKSVLSPFNKKRE